MFSIKLKTSTINLFVNARSAQHGASVADILACIVLFGILLTIVMPKFIVSSDNTDVTLDKVSREIRLGFENVHVQRGLVQANSNPAMLIDSTLARHSREAAPSTIDNACGPLLTGPATVFTLKQTGVLAYIPNAWEHSTAPGGNDFADLCLLDSKKNVSRVVRVFRETSSLVALNNAGGEAYTNEGEGNFFEVDSDDHDVVDGGDGGNTTVLPPTLPPSVFSTLFLDYSPIQKWQRYVHNNSTPALHMAQFNRQRKFAKKQREMIKQLLDDQDSNLTPEKKARLQDFLDRWEYKNAGWLLNAYNSSGGGYYSPYYMPLYMSDQIWIRNVYLYIDADGNMPWMDQAGVPSVWAVVDANMPPKPDRGFYGIDSQKLAYIETLLP